MERSGGREEVERRACSGLGVRREASVLASMSVAVLVAPKTGRKARRLCDLVFIEVLNNKNESRCKIRCKDFPTLFWNIGQSYYLLWNFKCALTPRGRNYCFSRAFWDRICCVGPATKPLSVLEPWPVLLFRDNPGHLSIVMWTIFRNTALPFHKPVLTNGIFS